MKGIAMTKTWIIAAVCVISAATLAWGFQEKRARSMKKWAPQDLADHVQGYVDYRVSESLPDGYKAEGTVLLSQPLATLDATPRRVRVLALEIELHRSDRFVSSMVQIIPILADSRDAYSEVWPMDLLSEHAGFKRRLDIRPSGKLRWADVRKSDDLVVSFR
jgi:hypothetical protein